jgi:tetratricopeptide (TPR) repeat protein
VTSILDRHRERFHANPTDQQAFRALEEHHFLAGEWDELVALYQQRLAAPDLEANPQARAPVLFRLAQVWEERHQDLDRAAAAYGDVLRADPRFHPALRPLRCIHLARSQWDIALQIAEIEVELPMRADERASLLAEMGTLWLDHLKDPEAALVHFERALDEHPDHVQALEGAARVYRDTGRAPEAIAAWERLATQSEGAERALALVEQAKLAAGALDQAERATELYRRALTDDPHNREAIEAVATHAAAAGHWELLADLCERRFELTSDGVHRAEIAMEAGRLHLEQLHDLNLAQMWLGRAIELEPENAAAYQALADVERERGDEEALLRCLERVVELREDAPPVWALLEAASLHSERSDDLRALENLQQALEQAPDDALVFEALSDTFARLGRDDELVDVLERRAELVADDGPARAALLSDLGALCEERLADPESACRAYQRAFQASPTAPGVAAALERLYRKAESWDALRELLEAAGRDGPEEERATFLCSLGALLASHLDDGGESARAFEAALAVDPLAAAAHRGLQQLAKAGGSLDAVRVAYEREAAVTSDRSRLAFLVSELTRLLESQDQTEAAVGWVERWVAAEPESSEALSECARLHERLGHHDEVIAALEKLDALVQSDEQAALRRRLGALHNAAGRRDHAIRAYESALEADPGDIEALETLVVQLDTANRLEDLADAWRRLAELLPPPRRAHCLAALSSLLADRLGDVSGAIEALTGLAGMEGAPEDLDERLEALLERAGRHEDLAEHLRSRLEALAAGSPEATAVALRLAHQLLEHLDRSDQAADAYRELLVCHPESSEARDGLERALRASGDAAGLIEFLGEQAESAAQPATRDRCALERAVLLEESPAGVDRARDAYQQLASSACDPALRSEASQRLEVLLERSGAWNALREHLEASLERSDDEDDGQLHERLGTLCRDRLGDRDGAAAHFERAAQLAPQRAELWRALASLYEQAERSQDLDRVLEAELATGPDPQRELALRGRAAELCAGALDQPDRARAHYERVLELDPSHAAAAEFLIEQWERDGRPAAVVRLLEARLASLDAAPRDDDGEWAAKRASLRLRIAGLRATSLDDLDGAIAVLEPALGELGPLALLAEPLADLYQRAGYAEDLLGLCQRAASACSDAGERANWSLRIGDTLRGEGRDREAADAYRRVLADRPDDRAAQGALRDLYRKLDEPEPLARLLETEIAHLAGRDEIPMRMELASLLAGPLSRPADALGQLRRVLQIEPQHAEALDRALDLAEILQRHEAILEMLEAALARSQPPSARAGLLARRASLLAHVQNRPDEAVATYREALSLDPNRTALRTELRAVLESQGQWDAVLDCLYQEARDADADTRARVLERAVDTAWEQIGPNAALPWLERLRRLRPEDPAVVEKIARIHRAAGRPEALLRALEDEIALTPDSSRQCDLHLERARILEADLESPTRAIAALEAARRLTPCDGVLLRNLERLLDQAGRTRERAEVLEAMLANAEDAERIPLLCDAAALYSGSLADPQRAAAHLRTAVEEVPQKGGMRAELLRAFGEALQAAGPPDAWARCAEEELCALDTRAPVFDDRRRTLHRELAATYERELGRPDTALRHLRALVSAPPSADDPAASAALDEAEAALLRLLEAEGNWVELESRLAVHLERRPDDLEGWLGLAHLRAEKLRTPASAIAAYRELLQREPGCVPALRGLRAAAERVGDWQEVARTLEIELEHSPAAAPAERSALLRRLGHVCWQRLQSTTRASSFFAAALEVDPHDFESLRALENLLEAMEDWRGALDLYESEAAMLDEDDTERLEEVWLRAAELARDRTGENQRALRAYMRAAALGPLPLEHRRALAELHRGVDDLASFADVFADWCDDPAADATCADHLELAETLAALDQPQQALRRVDRAVQVDDSFAPAWDLAARLREAAGDAEGAAEALAREADLVSDGEGAERLLRAAELCESRDPEGAAELLRSATRRDPANRAARASLARVAEGLGVLAEAEESAGRALDLAAAAGASHSEFAAGVALVGGRTAHRRGRCEEAARFFSLALEAAPEQPEALAGYGEALAELGDLAGARGVLETRLAQGDAYPERARHLVIAGRALVAEGEPDAALERFEAAIGDDARLDPAHAQTVDLHQAAGRIDEGIACLERWADAAREPEERAERLLRAAEWELEIGEREESAERHLREVLEVDPDCARAWEALAEHLWEGGRSQQALEVATGALEGIDDPSTRCSLALIRGRALEQHGKRRVAVDAFETASAADPTCAEAALSRARLLRGMGEWRAASDALREFAGQDAADGLEGLTEVLEQLGRLLAGPLEDVDGAIAVYQRSLEVEPERWETRATLAELLSHRPDDWQAALAHHRVLLDADPTRAASLRGVLRIAQNRGDDAAVTNGRAILRALGVDSPGEWEQAPVALSLSVAARRALGDPLQEKLRRIASAAADEIAEALGASARPGAALSGDPTGSFRAAAFAAEGLLTAPALLPLPDSELGEVLTVVATLALESGQTRGGGQLVNAMSAALGRRARRRLRRLLAGTSLDAIAQVDFAAWRSEVRALAAAIALDGSGGDLRTALVALLCEASESSPHDLPPSADLTPLVAACPEARALLHRSVCTWMESL